jgi:starch-binding outer membrane protein, SusD/RagB family
MRTRSLGIVLACVGTAACNTTVTSPDVITAPTLTGAAGLPYLEAGAYQEFAQAYLGSGYSASLIDQQAQESQALVTALFTDEMHESDFYTNHLQIDLRAQSRDNATLDNLWYLLHRARVAGDQTAAGYVQYDSTNPGRLTMLNLSGFASEMLAESFCGNIPLGSYNTTTGDVIYGAPVGTDSVIRVAKNHFLMTLLVASHDTQSANVSAVQYEVQRALVGLARALAYEGHLDSAATVAAQVMDTYKDSIERSANSPAEQNGVYYYTNIEVRYGITSGEGTNGLNFAIDGANGDPRIQVGYPNSIQTIIGYDDFTLDTVQQKYPGYGASGVLAGGAEARLIQAEDYLVDGNPGAALSMINQARQDAVVGGMASIPNWPAGITQSEMIDTLFAERAYDLWLTGHRVGDLRRLVRPTGGMTPGYGRDPTTEWPTGTYFKGGSYGTNVALLIPRDEDNNPQYSDAGCNQGNTP